MFKKTRLGSILVFILIILVACSGNNDISSQETEEMSNHEEDVELVVSAAASLTDAMNEVGENYMEEHPNVDLKFNFGSSGLLMQQIMEGAPSDLFFSAAEDKFEKLVDENRIDSDYGVDLLNNSLVLIVPENENDVETFEDLTYEAVDKIAVGTPETVPAGKYAEQALNEMGLWEELESKMVYTKDVRQVLQYVETGNVVAGVVYKTDALISDKVKIVAEADADTHTPITYPVGIINDSQQFDAAEAFYTYLQSEEVLRVFEHYGFNVE